MLFWAFLLKRYKMWRVYRETFAQLAELDDRALADINLRRDDIGAVSRRAALGVAA